MQRYLAVAVIVLLCMHSLMPRVKGCNPSLRPGKNRQYPCVADVSPGSCSFTYASTVILWTVVKAECAGRTTQFTEEGLSAVPMRKAY
ncbi:hypothetical protein V5799_000334 [Amblyomma americanum]|uniref:Secreted protein n=1 Tax=Amblyomma americanum TaxID=6943 RepID=A0AAQ4D3C4_AMBAM